MVCEDFVNYGPSCAAYGRQWIRVFPDRLTIHAILARPCELVECRGNGHEMTRIYHAFIQLRSEPATSCRRRIPGEHIQGTPQACRFRVSVELPTSGDHLAGGVAASEPMFSDSAAMHIRFVSIIVRISRHTRRE